MIEEIKKEIEEAIEEAIEDGQPFVYNETLNSILDKYKNQEEKYICKHLKFCKDGFNLDGDCVWEEYAMMANGNMKLHLENEELLNFKNAWEDLYNKNLMLKTPNMKLLQLEMKELEQKHGIKED